MQLIVPTAKSRFAKGEIDWEGDAFIAVAMEATHTYSAAHEFRDDLTGVLGTAALAGMVVLADGWCDATDVTITGMTPGLVAARFAICKNVGTAATDPIVWYSDTFSNTTAMNRTVDGSGSITFSFHNGAGRIFQVAG